MLPRLTSFALGACVTAPLYLLLSQNLRAQTQRVESLVSATRLELAENVVPEAWGSRVSSPSAQPEKAPFFDDVKRSFRKNWNELIHGAHDQAKRFL